MTSAVSSMTVAKRAACAAFVLASVAALPSVARAEGPASNATHAESLFREGRTLLDSKRYDEACPKLAESQKQEPGAGTLLALALCHEGQGKTATAYNDLLEAAQLGKRVGRNDLAAAAQKRAQAMEPLLARLVVRTPRGDDTGYDVKRDGEALDAKQLGTPTPVDPGEHRIDVSARGKLGRSYVVRLAGAGSVEIVIDKLEDAARAPAPAVAKSEPSRLHIANTAPVLPEEESRGGAQRAIGLVVVGLGVAGLGTGAYFGGKALSESAESRRTCTTTPCSSESMDANNRAKSSATAGIVSVAAGTGAIALGTVIYMMAPSNRVRGTAPSTRMTARIAPEVSPTQATLGVTGAF
jgi:hypothetical protein